jgi:hypothetical protein
MSDDSAFKDFAEHLRNIHFSLVAVCIGLIVIISSPAPTQLNIAHQQLLDIIELQKRWNPAWLDETADKEAEQIVAERQDRPMLDAPSKSFPKNVTIDDEPLRLAFGFRNWIVESPEPSVNLRFNPPPTPAELSELQKQQHPVWLVPLTLTEFRRSWDFFEHPKMFVAVGLTGHYFLQKPKSDVGSDWKYESYIDLPANAKITQTVRMNFTDRKVLEAANPSLKRAYIGYILADENSSLMLILPVAEVEHDLDVQSVLINAASSHWRHGKFETAFAELNDITSGLQDLDLSSLEKNVRKQAERSAESFAAFGIKFPIELAAAWGIPIVLVIQTYLLLHLREFRSLGDQGKSKAVAWIALYDSLLAQLIFTTSALLLPVVTILLLSRKVIWYEKPDIWHGFGVLILLSISAAIAIRGAAIFYSGTPWGKPFAVLKINSRNIEQGELFEKEKVQ